MPIPPTENSDEESIHDALPMDSLSNKPIRLAVSFFLMAFFFRIVDIFVLEMNTTDFGILPSKIIPLVLILLYLKQTRKTASSIGVHSGNWENNVILAVLTAVAFNGILIGGSFGTLLFLNMQPHFSIYKMDYIAFDLVFQTANAIMEEMLFRGLMLLCFMRTMRPAKANLLQAFLFGLWHVVWPINSYLGGIISPEAAIGWTIEYVLSSMTIGLLWGYMFQKTGSLISPILLHFTINFIGAYIIIEPSMAMIKLGFAMLALLMSFATVLFFARRVPMCIAKANRSRKEEAMTL